MKTYTVLVKSGKHTYAREVWSERRGKKVIQHYVRALGRATRDKDGNIVLLGKKIPSDFVVYDYADAQLLFSLAEKLSLPVIINEKVGANTEIKNPGMLLTLLAVAHASGNLSFPKFQFWYSYSWLKEKAGMDEEELTPTSISRTLEKISWKPSIGSQDVVGDIVYDVEMELWKKIEEIEGKEAPIYYDVTPVYTYSEKLEIALLGRPGGKKLPRINVGLIVSRPNALPIMHRIFPGNVTDKVTLGEISALLKKKFGLRKNMVVLDRGFDPETALKCLINAKLGYLIALPFQSKEICSIATSVPEEKICRAENLFLNEYAMSVERKLFGRVERFILIFNPAKKAAERLLRDGKIKETMQALESYREKLRKGNYTDENRVILRIDRILHGVGEYFGYELKKSGERISDLTFYKKEDAIKKAKLLDGRFMLVCSDEKMSIEGCIELYRDRDLIEKTFRTFKGQIGVEPTRCRRLEQVNARIFISYLSYLLLSYLRYLMRKHKFVGVSVEELLMKANRIKIVRNVEESGVVFSAISSIRAKERKIIPFLRKFIKV
jgi:transposase